MDNFLYTLDAHSEVFSEEKSANWPNDGGQILLILLQECSGEPKNEDVVKWKL